MLVYILKHDVLVRLRKEKALSQKAAAKKAGITLRTWQNAEHGRRVRSDTAGRIARALEVPLSEIIERDDNSKFSNNTQQSKDAYKNCLLRIAELIDDELGQSIDRLDQSIDRIIHMWFQDGEKSLAKYPGLPQHPEYVYRLNGDWKGWIKFLNISPDDKEYETYQRIGEIENRAFRIVRIILDEQIRRLRDKVETGEITMEVGLEIVTCAMNKEGNDLPK